MLTTFPFTPKPCSPPPHPPSGAQYPEGGTDIDDELWCSLLFHLHQNPVVPTPPPSGAQYPGGGDVVLFAACANILAEANKKMKEDGWEFYFSRFLFFR